ncbi:MAG: transketolase [Thermoleophilaceae bacterium]|nr:transketolase [Thermoleophilaceae bacterium]
MTLRYVGAAELARIRAIEGQPVGRAAAFADACRINTLYMIMRAGSGHVGTSFSSIDILSWLHLELLGPEDRYFSSKGHDAPALYSVLLGTGVLDFELIHGLRRLDGLPGHPDVLTTPAVQTNTGSLGMGISKARGFVLADRALGRPGGSVYVLTGDGELQEGQFWESLQPTANRGLHQITVIVDHNKLQSDTWVSQVSDLGDLEARVASCGWAVGRCDGNDLEAFSGALRELGERAGERPRMLIADTIKGAGVSFMEPYELPLAGDSLYDFHSGAPSADQYERGFAELRERLDRRLDALEVDPIELVEAAPNAAPTASVHEPQRLIGAYGTALVEQARNDTRLVVLDADLSLDCGLMPFRAEFPDRFFECGIAEQDMVSQAGAMALAGLLPVVHSFACFLSTRPNEQIYNNATEGTKVIYVGSLVGLVPGGPGHSHQSVRDISALGAMPGMAMIEPGSEQEVAQAVEWAVREAPGSVYIRLVSVPWELSFEPAGEQLVAGRGRVVREGTDATMVASGPVMLTEAFAACELLAAEGLSCGLVALPWLRDIDGEWLAEVCGGVPILCLDNHYVSGGQGDAVLSALAPLDRPSRVTKLGVESVPVCGANAEVLRAHRLDAPSIAERISSFTSFLPPGQKRGER